MRQRARMLLAMGVLGSGVVLCLGQAPASPSDTLRILRAENKLLRAQVEALKERAAALAEDNARMKRQLAARPTSRPTTRPAAPLTFSEIHQVNWLPFVTASGQTKVDTPLHWQNAAAWIGERAGRDVLGEMIVTMAWAKDGGDVGAIGYYKGDLFSDAKGILYVTASFDPAHAPALAKIRRGWTLTLEGKLKAGRGRIEGSQRWRDHGIGRTTIALTGCRPIKASPPKKPKKAGR